MELGLITNTHGCGGRDDTDWWHQPMPPEEMRPVESAQLAERLGFYMVSFGDHVAFPEASPESLTPVYREGRSNLEVRQRGELEGDVGSAKRHYPPKPNILDGMVVMGAIATQTSRIKMGFRRPHLPLSPPPQRCPPVRHHRLPLQRPPAHGGGRRLDEGRV